MRKFVVADPSGNRLPPREAETLAEVTGSLVEGYVVVAEVLPGIEPPFTVEPPLPDGLKRYTAVTWMLLRHEDEFREMIRSVYDKQLKDIETAIAPSTRRIGGVSANGDR